MFPLDPAGPRPALRVQRPVDHHQRVLLARHLPAAQEPRPGEQEETGPGPDRGQGGGMFLMLHAMLHVMHVMSRWRCARRAGSGSGCSGWWAWCTPPAGSPSTPTPSWSGAASRRQSLTRWHDPHVTWRVTSCHVMSCTPAVSPPRVPARGGEPRAAPGAGPQPAPHPAHYILLPGHAAPHPGSQQQERWVQTRA